MPSSDPIDILIASDAWGTRTLLDSCAKLTREQFHQKFPIGLGSLHETLTHIISVHRRWTDRLAERPPRPTLHTIPSRPDLVADAKDRTPVELHALNDASEQDLVQVMRNIRAHNRLDTIITVDWPSGADIKQYTFTRGTVLVHLTTHGYHHRAQCLNMLRHLSIPGISDHLPEPSAVDWQAATESPGVIIKRSPPPNA